MDVNVVLLGWRLKVALRVAIIASRDLLYLG
jgi:hypothetical protein